MSLFQSLFTETANHGVHKKHLKRISRICKRLGSIEKIIPKMNYPHPSSEKFKEDIEEVIRSIQDPCMSSGFLDASHSSVEDIYRDFLQREYNGCLDWDELSSVLEEADSIILRLKYKYKRERPKTYLVDIDNRYNDLKDSKSHSFPSGHTAMAYLLSGILGKEIPELNDDFLTLAEIIAQSRIENGVHFPTDILYGQLVGEMLADAYNNSNLKCKKDLKSSDYRKCSKFLRKNAENLKPNLEKQGAIKKYSEDLADFIHRTNEIEGYRLNYQDCKNAADEFIMGYPTKYITNNPHIESTLNSITMSKIMSPIDNIQKILSIHNVFNPSVIEKEHPGSIRHYEHFSPTGILYSQPNNIFSFLRKLSNINNRPVLKHILYEWIHPFCDGNGRSGRIILLSDLDYNFDIVNQIIGEDYIPMLRDYMENKNIASLLSETD